MKKGQIILMLAMVLGAGGIARAQDQAPSTATPPVAAFGQESPAAPVSENPPISAIDQPGLDPHASPESFLLPGLHFSQSVDSNVGNELGGSSTQSVTRALGSLTLQRLWKTYDVAADYIGGVAYYGDSFIGLEQLQQFDVDNRINWKRGQLAIRDSFSYLPEGTFGFGAYGGAGAYNSGLGMLGAGMLGAGAFAGQTSAFNGGSGESITPGVVPRLTNLGLVDVVEDLTPKSAITMAAGYGLVHFYGALNEENPIVNATLPANITFLGSQEYTGQVAYDRSLNAKDQLAVSYGYQDFLFSLAGVKFHTNVIQGMYGHRISGRMDFLISAGPQFTHVGSTGCVDSFLGINIPLQVPLSDCVSEGGTLFSSSANRIALAGRASLRYKFSQSNITITLQRYDTSGNGVYAGAVSTIGHLDYQRRLTRVWDMFGDLGYSKNQRLQLPDSSVNASSYTYGFAGIGLHRQFSRSLRAFVSYQFNEVGYNSNICPTDTGLVSGACVNASGTTVTPAPLSNLGRRQVGSIGLDWTPRPLRLD